MYFPPLFYAGFPADVDRRLFSPTEILLIKRAHEFVELEQCTDDVAEEERDIPPSAENMDELIRFLHELKLRGVLAPYGDISACPAGSLFAFWYSPYRLIMCHLDPTGNCWSIIDHYHDPRKVCFGTSASDRAAALSYATARLLTPPSPSQALHRMPTQYVAYLFPPCFDSLLTQMCT